MATMHDMKPEAMAAEPSRSGEPAETPTGAYESRQGPAQRQLQRDLDGSPRVAQLARIQESLDGADAVAQKKGAVVQKKPATGLPSSLRSRMEGASGVPLDDVKVHYDSQEPAQLQAAAFTRGSEIHVGPGQEQHLGHEAWHVVQQKEGRVSPTTKVDGVAVNDDAGLEKEADRMGG